MSCKYCDLKRRKDDDDDAEWIAGEDWESESEDGGYICPHGDGFRMLVYYDARYACTAVDNIKYCPFCGAELTMPAEPLIKDEKVRKAVRAWAEAIEINDKVAFNRYSNGFSYMENEGLFSNITFDGRAFDFVDGKLYSIAELCGEDEE